MYSGVTKSLARLRQYYFWSRLTIQVREYLLGSNTYKETERTTQVTRPPMGNEVITDHFMEKVCLYFRCATYYTKLGLALTNYKNPSLESPRSRSHLNINTTLYDASKNSTSSSVYHSRYLEKEANSI